MKTISIKLRLLLTLQAFFLSAVLFGQIPPPPPAPVEADTIRLQSDSVTIEYYGVEPAPLEMPSDMYDVTEAPAYEYVMVNKFKHNSKLKPVVKPDQPAAYSEGLGVMLRFIAGNINHPYSYFSSGTSEIVLVRVIVGKDSLLYNPEILNSPGTVYSVNAQEVIEKLPSKFVPATKNGMPVDSYLIIPVRFETGLRNNYSQF